MIRTAYIDATHKVAEVLVINGAEEISEALKGFRVTPLDRDVVGPNMERVIVATMGLLQTFDFESCDAGKLTSEKGASFWFIRSGRMLIAQFDVDCGVDISTLIPTQTPYRHLLKILRNGIDQRTGAFCEHSMIFANNPGETLTSACRWFRTTSRPTLVRTSIDCPTGDEAAEGDKAYTQTPSQSPTRE